MFERGVLVLARPEKPEALNKSRIQFGQGDMTTAKTQARL